MDEKARLADLERMLAQIAAVVEESPDCRDEMGINRASGDSTHRSPTDLALDIVGFRQCRDQMFPEIGFSDPAWDIILNLYIAGHDGRVVSISKACDVANASKTTALRKIWSLIDCGIVLRNRDNQDRRRAGLSINEEISKNLDNLIIESEIFSRL